MPGKTPREAVQAYIDPLQKSLALISEGVLRCDNRDRIDDLSVLRLPDPVSLHGRSHLFIGMVQQYRIIKDPNNGPFRVTTAHYKYTLETEDSEEIIGYHWHPEGPSPVRYAHLHLGAGAQIGRSELDGRAHFPTGRVAFEDFVKLLIDVFDVKASRPTWRQALDRTKGLFERYKRW